MESIKTQMTDALTKEFAKAGVPLSKKNQYLKNLEEETNARKKDYLNYLKDVNDVGEIYNLIRNKKLSKNQIRTKLKSFLKEPQDLNKFLQAILDSKGEKKEETTEATSAGGSSGAFEPMLSGGEEKKIDTKNIPTVRESLEKVETKEATASGSSGQYSQPAIWAKSMSKKHWKGASTKYMPGAKRVQVKKKCKKFPYCNQGDINALKIFESESVQNAIDSVSSNYGYNKDYISEILFKEIRKTQK